MENKTNKKLQDIAAQLGLPTELKKAKGRKHWIKTTLPTGLFFELEVVKGNVWRLIVEYGNEENAKIIFDAHQHLDPYMKGKGCWFVCDSAKELLATATEVKDFILAKGLTRRVRGGVPSVTSNEGLFEKTAQGLIAFSQIGCWDLLDKRGFFDNHDDFAKISESPDYAAAKAANPNYVGRREHIVPCTMILAEAIRMAEAKATVGEIAQMLKSNLAIVMISDEEQKRLDAVYQTAMPAGWNFGDSIFARLDAMDIKY